MIKVRIIEDDFASFERGTRLKAGVAAKEACEDGAVAARARAPRATGALVASIQAADAEDGGSIVAAVGYARYQEFGTQYVRARHFLYEGLNVAKDAFPEKMRGRL
jgi:HK97 gp10 family phage protein